MTFLLFIFVTVKVVQELPIHLYLCPQRYSTHLHHCTEDLLVAKFKEYFPILIFFDLSEAYDKVGNFFLLNFM